MQAGYLTTPSIAGTKNAIINGSCQVGQRGDQTATTNGWTWGALDRYQIALNFTTVHANGMLLGHNTSYSSVDGFNSAIRLRPAVDATGATSGSQELITRQRIEANNSVPFKNKSATFSCYVEHNFSSATAKDVWVVINKANAKDNFSGVTAITTSATTSVATGTATRFEATIADMGDCSNGIEVKFYVGIAEDWTAIGDTVDITGLQLELGSEATAFEHLPYHATLAACQRYYWRATAGGANAGLAGTAVSRGSGFIRMTVPLPVTMRSSPTMTESGLEVKGSNELVYAMNAIGSEYGGAENCYSADWTVTSFPANISGAFSFNTAGSYADFSAEL